MPLTIQHAKSDTLADWSGTVTVNNSTGGTTTVAASNLVRPSDWNSQHNSTLSLTGSEIASLFTFNAGLSSTTGAGGITAGIQTQAFFEPFPLHNTNSTLSAPGIGTWYLDGPYLVPDGFGSGQINMLMSNAAGFVGVAAYSASGSGARTYTQTFYNCIALYTQGGGASTSRLESAWSTAHTLVATWVQQLSTANTSSGSFTNALSLSFPAQWDTAGNVTYSTTAQSGSTTFGASTIASSAFDSLITGAVAYVSGAYMAVFGMATNLPPDNYWFAHQLWSTSASVGTVGGIPANRLFSTHSRLGLLENNVGAYKRQGLSVSNSSTNVQPFHGYLATTTSVATSIINTSDIRATTGRAYWNNFVTTY